MRKNVSLTAAFLAGLFLAGQLFTGCGAPKAETVPAAQETAGDAKAAEDEGNAVEEDKNAAEESGNATEVSKIYLEDGVYTAEFDTDNSMFRVCEAMDGKGTLTVTDGQAVLHVSLASKNIVNLYPGTVEEAKEDEAGWLQPTVDPVTYSDGFEDEVFGFDIPVPCIGEEFDLALIGKKGTWYDHKVIVENPVPADREAVIPEDGTYTCEVSLEGGSGRASVETPVMLSVQDGEITAHLVWNSPYYEYMVVDQTQYDPLQTEGNSAFEIPVVLDEEMSVSASTVAMSKPHLIEYTLCFDSSTLEGE